MSTDDAPDGLASIRERGVLFHEVAEHATKHGLETVDEWITLCDDLAERLGLEHAVSEAVECIHRFFETPAAEWNVLAAEREFTLDIEGYEVTGLIDAICEKPDGSIVVLDYKATTSKRELETNKQLPLYLLACESILDQPVEEAGYVYVGQVGPSVETRRFSEDDLVQFTKKIVGVLERAEQSNYSEFTAGEHCRYCSHKSLSCSQQFE